MVFRVRVMLTDTSLDTQAYIGRQHITWHNTSSSVHSPFEIYGEVEAWQQQIAGIKQLHGIYGNTVCEEGSTKQLD